MASKKSPEKLAQEVEGLKKELATLNHVLAATKKENRRLTDKNKELWGRIESFHRTQ